MVIHDSIRITNVSEANVVVIRFGCQIKDLATDAYRKFNSVAPSKKSMNPIGSMAVKKESNLFVGEHCFSIGIAMNSLFVLIHNGDVQALKQQTRRM
jgi:hypothetical protein